MQSSSRILQDALCVEWTTRVQSPSHSGTPRAPRPSVASKHREFVGVLICVALGALVIALLWGVVTAGLASVGASDPSST